MNGGAILSEKRYVKNVTCPEIGLHNKSVNDGQK
jgi:hypothetical protein